MTAVENFAKIKQPEPVVSNNNNVVVKRQYTMPNVGIIAPAKISASPIADTLVLKEQENPKMAFKTKYRRYKLITPQFMMFLGIIGTGILSTFKLFKK